MQTTVATNQAPESLAIPPTMAAPVAPNRFVTIKQCAQVRPAFSEAALRDIRFKAYDRENSRGDVIEGNGTGEAGVWIEVASKVLIDLDAFDRWIESHKTAGAK